MGGPDRWDLIRDLEAVLFVSDEPLSTTVLSQSLEADRRAIEEALVDLASSYEDRESGIVLRNVAGRGAVRAVLPSRQADQGIAGDPGHRGLQAAGHPAPGLGDPGGELRRRAASPGGPGPRGRRWPGRD